MKPLTVHRQMLTWLSICPPEANATLMKKYLYIIFTVLDIIIVFGVTSASLVYFVKMVLIDLQESLYALLQIVVYFGIIYVIFVAILLRHKISGIFDKLSLIYETCKNKFDSIDFKKSQ